MSIIPEKSNNFRVYLDGSTLLGIAEGNFPNGELMTSEVKGAGIAGVIDSPTLGHMNSITCEFNWRNVTESFVELIQPGAHSLDLYAEHQDFDAGRGEYKTRSIHVFMKAITKQYDIGKLVVGESSETQTTHEVYYMKLYIDGKEKIELDKYNFVYKINGFDYLQNTRKNLGMY